MGADPAKPVVQLPALVGRLHLVGVVDGVLELELEQQHHLQMGVEEQVHQLYHWPGACLEELEVHWQTKCEACSFGNLDCLQPKLFLHHNSSN